MRIGRHSLKIALALSVASSLGGCGGGGSSDGTPTPTASGNPGLTPVLSGPNNPSPSPSPSPTGTTGAGDESFDAAMLRLHNVARGEIGTPALVQDDKLVEQAKAYAEKLAATGQFQHSPSGEREGQGENLWAGTASRFSYDDMAGAWIDEKQYYIHDRFPYVSKTGNWGDVGHYTQIIWRDTTRLGCGLATGGGRDVVVCRYAPAGNVVGQFAF